MKASAQFRSIKLVLLLSVVASCARHRQVINDPAPAVLDSRATLEDVIRVVNANSAGVRQIQSSGATLTVPGGPPLAATYAFERPNRFRLRAEVTRITGPEIDLGSNDELYWMWLRQSPDKAILWGRHDEFYRSAARNVLPVPPSWMIEALGVVELDPTGQHEGPYPRQAGQLELRSTIPTPAGMLTKVTVVDDTRGWILEQHLYDQQLRLLASAIASGFQHDPASGSSLPRFVKISLPSAEMNFTLQTDRHLINQLAGDPGLLWSMPQMNGFPLVNLDRLPVSTSNTAPLFLADRPTQDAPEATSSTEEDLRPRRLPFLDNPLLRNLRR